MNKYNYIHILIPQCDLEEQREVSLEEMEAFVTEHNLNGCIEVSSKMGYNVNEAMK